MLVRPHDAPLSDAEWKTLLAEHDFGQFIAPGRDREFPVIVPTHFAFDGDRTVLTHFSKANPVWEALRERPRAALSIVADYVYVPSDWNAGEEAPPEYGVPTSYYAAVQVFGDVETVDEPDALADLLARQMRHFQPQGGHAPVEAGDNPYGRQMPAIRGVLLRFTDVKAKLKYGGNRPPAHRERVAALLAERAGPMDAEARGHLLRRLGGRHGPNA
jgi:transcriptional regulator